MSGMESLNKNVGKAMAGAAVTGACAGVGGLIGGPVGMAVGGVVVGIASATAIEFRSVPDVIENDFSPPERQALIERAKQGVGNLVDLALKLFFRLLKEFRNFESVESFKRSVLLPLIEELACLGVTKLIELIKIAFF